MSSNQLDCLTSLVSYVPDFNFGFNLPSTTTVNQLGLSAANQQRQSVPLPSEPLTPLEVVSARANINRKCIPQSGTSPEPLRSALKKTSLSKSCNNVDEQFKSSEKGYDANRILVPDNTTGTAAKSQKPEPQKPLPARLTQKKKTVAFGRTVNVSQTVEGTSRTNRKFLADSNSRKKTFPKMASDGQIERLLDEFDKLKKEVSELQLKISELTMRDSERSDQFLKLTETLKGILTNFPCNNNEDSKGRDGRNEMDFCYCDKENIPPEKIARHIAELDKGNRPKHDEPFAESRKKTMGSSSKEDLKWTIMKRKYSECEEFKRLVDEAIMRCGGDESLDIFASHHNKGDIDRLPTRGYEQKPQPVSPVIRSTTRVMKQMTVQQIQHCENSPASCAFSYDSKKYLARHGIIPALSDDDEVEHTMARGKQLYPSVSSYYHPGNSITYYSKNIKCSNMPLKDNSHNDYREERCQHKRDRTAPVFDDYQIDQFDIDDDEDLNNMIEINNGFEQEEYCRTGGKMCSPHERGYRDLRRNDLRNQDDGLRQYNNQRRNKPAWD